MALVLVPEDLGIAKFRIVDVEDRVPLVLGEGQAAVMAVGDRLLLLGLELVGVRVDRDDGRPALRAVAESGGVVLVDDGAAREDPVGVAAGDRDRQLVPG
jgi:hypothetical protein